MLQGGGIPVITVSDIGASTAFYRDRLGFSVKVETPGWVEFDVPGQGLALHGGGTRVDLEARVAGRVSFSVQVEDVEQTYDALRKRGVDFIMGPTRQDFGVTMAVFQDPDGVNWHLVEREKKGA